jgi:hypothetical protein
MSKRSFTRCTVWTAGSILLVSLVLPASGQIAWEWNDSYYSQVAAGLFIKPSFADMDADGLIDLTVGNMDGDIIFYQNVGTATDAAWIADPTLYESIDADIHATPALAPLHDPDKFDLVCGGKDGLLVYYRNEGTPETPLWVEDPSVFTDIDIGNFSAPSFGDLDGDGDLDLALGTDLGELFYFENTGSPTDPVFPNEPDSLLFIEVLVSGHATPHLKDFDGDGDLDLAVGAYDGYNRYYENIGTPTEPELFEVIDFFLEVKPSPNTAPAFADLDSDGDFDLTVGKRGGTLEYYLNDAGSWTKRTDDMFGRIDIGTFSSPTLGDFDNDGDYDLIIGRTEGDLVMYQNLGDSTNPVWRLDTLTDHIRVDMYACPHLVDLDDDDDLDMVIGNVEGNLIYCRFDDTNWVVDTVLFRSLDIGDLAKNAYPALGDLDGDGDYDLAVGTFAGKIFYYENIGDPGTPRFTEVGDTTMFETVIIPSASAPTFIDLDEDGLLDLTVGSGAEKVLYHFRNVGSPEQPEWQRDYLVFTGISRLITYRATPVYADLNGDGLKDLTIGSNVGTFRFFRNLGDISLPRVLSTDPGNGESNVPADVIVTAEFNKDLDSVSVNNVTFRLTGSVTGEVQGSVVYNPTSRIATFMPYEPFVPQAPGQAERVDALLSGTIRDLEGNGLDGNDNKVSEGSPYDDYRWTFYIETAEPDTIHPRVVSTYPLPDARNVPLDTVITITFSEYMKESSLNESTIIIISSLHETVPGTLSYVDSLNTVTFEPETDFTIEDTVTVTATAGCQDRSSNSLIEYFFTFFTEDTTHPKVDTTNLYPAPGDTVPVDIAIVIPFTESIDTTTVTRESIYLVTQYNDTLWGDFTYDETVVTLTPDEDLPYNVGITGVVTTDIVDLTGLPIVSPYTWSFWTERATFVVYPNPYKPNSGLGHTEITFHGFTGLPFSEPAKGIEIYNIAGELVHRVKNLDPGARDEWTWPGTNSSGKNLASGVYIYRIVSRKGEQYIGKLAIIR